MSDPVKEKDTSEDVLDVTCTCNDTESASSVAECNVINESEIKIDDLVKPSMHQTVLTHASNSIISVKKDKEILENPNFDNVVDDTVSQETSKELVISHECKETLTLAVDDDEKETEKELKLSYKSKENAETEEIFDIPTKFEEEITTIVNGCSADSTSTKPLEELTSIINVVNTDAKATETSINNFTDHSSIEELTISDNNVLRTNNTEAPDEHICCEECNQIFITSNTAEEYKCESNEISEKISGSSDDLKTVKECEFSEESTGDKNEQTLNDDVLETSVFYEKNSPILQENLKIAKEPIDDITVDEQLTENKNSKLSSQDISREVNSKNKTEVFAITPHKSEVALKDELFVNLDECTENNSGLNIHNLENRSISTDENNDEPLLQSFIKETIIDSSSSIEEEAMHPEPVTSVKEELNICNELLKSNYSDSIDDIKNKELIDTSIHIKNPDTEELIIKSSLLIDNNYNRIYSCQYNFSDRIICECFVGNLEDFSSHETLHLNKIAETGKLSENGINESIQTATGKCDSLLFSTEKEHLSSKIDGIASNLNLESDEEIPIKDTSSDVLAEKLFESIKEHLNLSEVKIWNIGTKSFYRNVTI